MKCPRCLLLNPDSAQRCDCGYDFASGTVLSSYATVEPEGGEDAGALLTLTWVCALLGGLIGWLLARHIMVAKVGSRLRYDGKSRASAKQARSVALAVALGAALLRFAFR